MPIKDLILVVAPNDFQIFEAVSAWEQRGYIVQTHVIEDTRTITEDLLGTIHKYEKGVRVLFTESAWGNIPAENRCLLLDRLWIEPKVRWIHWAKKMIDRTSPLPR